MSGLRHVVTMCKSVAGVACCDMRWHSTLHTLRFILHTLHFTHHTLHFTLHTTLDTLHSALQTPHSTPYTAHSTLYTPHFKLYTANLTPHTLHSTLYTLHSTLHTLYTPHSTLPTLHSTLHTLHSTLYTWHFTLSTPHFTLHTPHFTLHTLHFTLYTTPHFAFHPLPHSTGTVTGEKCRLFKKLVSQKCSMWLHSGSWAASCFCGSHALKVPILALSGPSTRFYFRTSAPVFCAMIKCVRSRSCPKRRAVYLGPHASVAGVCATLPQNLGGAVDTSTTSSWCSLQIKDDQKWPNMTKHQLHPPLLEAAWELHYETGWSCYTSNVLGLFKKSELQNPSKFHG